MGPGGPASGTDLADLLAPFDPLARAADDLRLVQVDADQALAVVDHDEAALEMHAARRHADHTTGGAEDGRALGRRQVRAVVRALGLAVEDALAAEPPGAAPTLGGQRHGEAAAEVLGVDAAGQGGLLDGVLFLQPGQQGRIAGADLVFRQARDALDVEVARGDGEDMAGRAAGAGDPQGAAGGGVTVEADDEQAAGAGAADGLLVQPDVGARRGAAEGEAALAPDAAQLERRRRGQRRAGNGRRGQAE